jgi:hypothetical protein
MSGENARVAECPEMSRNVRAELKLTKQTQLTSLRRAAESGSARRRADPDLSAWFSESAKQTQLQPRLSRKV